MKRFLISLSVSIVVVSGIAAQTPKPVEPPPDYRTTGVPPRPKQISGGVLNGKALSLPKPEYPEAARAVNASGTVTVQVLIDEHGIVLSAAAVSGHPLLRDAAVKAARSAQFAPTTLSGEPVKVAGVITYNFVNDVPSTAEPRELGLLGQIPASDRDSIWAIGFLLGMAQPADADVLRMIGDEKEFNDIWIDLAKDMPAEMGEYKPVLDRLAGSDVAARQEAAKDFLKLARKELNAAQTWQLDVGEQLGFMLFELVRQRALNLKTGATFDLSIARTHLKRISDLVTNAPDGASADNKARFKRIALFANADLSQESKLRELMNEIEPLFSAFDKDND